MALGGANATIRIVLTGARSAIAGIEATGAAVTGLAEKVRVLEAAETGATKRGFLMNQVLFTMRRYAYMGTLALTGAAVAFTKWGIDFNSTMQQATTALLPVMHGSQAVRDELFKLFNMAKYNPFRFQDMTTAFRSMFLAMQPLGITAQQVNQTLRAMTDALSATGRTSPAQLNRVAVALQHMAYQGRLTGFTVNQLARDGIPIFGALRKELGLTGDQLHNISALGIPTSVVLQAINRFIETQPGYMNAAARQAKTLNGQLATLKDNISQTMGYLTAGVFRGVSSGLLPSLNKTFDAIAARAKQQGYKLRFSDILDVFSKRYPQASGIFDLFKTLVMVLKPLGYLLKQTAIGLGTVLFVAGKISIALRPLIVAFTWLIKHVPGLQYIMIGLAASFVACYFAAKIAEAGGLRKWLLTLKLLGGSLKAAEVMMAQFAFMTRVTGWIAQASGARIKELWLIMMGKNVGGYGTVISRGGKWVPLSTFEKGIMRIGIAIRGTLIPAIQDAGVAMWAFLLDNPIGWIVLAVAAVVGGLVILYFKWQRFHDFVNKTAQYIWNHWYNLRLFVHEIVNLAHKLRDFWNDHYKAFEKLWHLAQPVLNWILKHWQWIGVAIGDPIATFTLWYKFMTMLIGAVSTLVGWVKRLIHWIGKIHIPSWLSRMTKTIAEGAWNTLNFATGGLPRGLIDYRTMGGPAFATPSGGAIPVTSPNQFARSMAVAQGQARPMQVSSTVHVHVDGKKVAEATAKHRQNKAARR